MNESSAQSSILESPRVSIGLPVYNGEKFLGEAINSILRQTYENLELIISDNASTDGTEAICRQAAARDRRVRYIRSENNVGASANYNRVYELSRGEYFKWAAHDDALMPEYIERCVDALDGSADDVVLCFPATIIIDEHGHEAEEKDERSRKLDLPMDGPYERMRHLLKNLGLCYPATGLIRSEVLRHTRLIDSFRGSDIVLLTELALLGKFRHVPERLFLRRLHPGTSLSHKSPEEVAVWYDPANRGKLAVHRTRIFLEQIRSVGRMPLSTVQRLRCRAFLLRSSIWHRRQLVTEWWSAARWLANRPRASERSP